MSRGADSADGGTGGTSAVAALMARATELAAACDAAAGDGDDGERLKLIGVVLTIALTLVDFATARASGSGVFLMRGFAGAIEGVMLWITVAMIARTATPERWAGVFFVIQMDVRIPARQGHRPQSAVGGDGPSRRRQPALAGRGPARR